MDTYFENGPKTNWRRQCWNAIAERVQDKRNARVLYFSAMDDRDRRVAVQKGFQPSNLISIDSRINVVGKLREENKVAIHGDMLDVLVAWPASSPVDVVFLDLCGGLTEKTMKMILALQYSPAFGPRTVVALNMLRGREQDTAERLKSVVAEYNIGDPKHRGRLFYGMMFSEALSIVCRDQGLTDSDCIPEYLYRNTVNVLYRLSRPFFTTYKSNAGNQRFDTIVYLNVLGADHSKRSIVELKTLGEKISPKAIKIANRIHANLAVQTMRKNGMLTASPSK